MSVKEESDNSSLKFVVFAIVVVILAVYDLSIWWAVLLLLLF